MRFPKALILLLVLCSLLLVSCGGDATPTPAPGQPPVSIPGVGKSGGETPAPARATVTPKAYPPPVTLPALTGTPYPGPISAVTLLEQRCTLCHDLTRIKTAKKTEQQWRATVDQMIANGARLSPEEKEVLIKYLAENFK